MPRDTHTDRKRMALAAFGGVAAAAGVADSASASIDCACRTPTAKPGKAPPAAKNDGPSQAPAKAPPKPAAPAPTGAPPEGMRYGPGRELMPKPAAATPTRSAPVRSEPVRSEPVRSEPARAEQPRVRKGPPPKGMRYGPGRELMPKPTAAPEPEPAAEPGPTPTAVPTPTAAPTPTPAADRKPPSPSVLPGAVRVQRDFPDGRRQRGRRTVRGPALNDGSVNSVANTPAEPGSQTDTLSCSGGVGGAACAGVPFKEDPPQPPDAAPQAPKTKVTAGVNGGVSVTRSTGAPELQPDGTHRQSVSVEMEDRIGWSVGLDKGARARGSFGMDWGHRTNTTVTTSPKRVRGIQGGTAVPPNPRRPGSFAKGDGVSVSQERFRGTEGSALVGVVGLGGRAEKGRKVTSAAERVTRRRMRLSVGEEQSRRSRLDILGADPAGLIGMNAPVFNRDYTTGSTNLLDALLDTRAGRTVFERFAEDGILPTRNVRGTRNAATAETATMSNGGGGWKLGPFSGGGPTRNGLKVTEVAYRGSRRRDNSMTLRSGDTTFIRDLHRDEKGRLTRNQSTELLEDVSADSVNPLLESQGQAPVEGDRNVAYSMTPDDTRALQDMALRQLSAQTHDTDDPMTPDEVKEQLQGGDDYVPGRPGSNHAIVAMIGGATHPNDVLSALHTVGRGRSENVTDFLFLMRNDTARKLHEAGEDVTIHDPSLRIPGRIRVLPEDPDE